MTGEEIEKKLNEIEGLTKENQRAKVGTLIDELSDRIDEQSHPKLYFRYLRAISTNHLKEGKIQEAIKTSLHLINFVKTLKIEESDLLLGKAISSYGWTLMQDSSFKESIDAFNDSLKLFIKCNDQSAIANTHNLLGAAHYYSGVVTKALEYWEQSLIYYEDHEDEPGMANVLSNLGNVYRSTGTHTKALEYYLKASELHQVHENNFNAGITFLNIANQYRDIGNLNESQRYLDLAEPIIFKIERYKFHTNWKLSQGETYELNGDYRRAIETFNNILETEQYNHKDTSTLEALHKIGRITANEKYQDYDLTKAKQILTKAYNLSQEKNIDSSLHGILAELKGICKKQAEWEEAAKYDDLLISIQEKDENHDLRHKLDSFMQERATIQEEKKRAEERAAAAAKSDLLHKVLPDKIARRMLDGEEKIADYFNSVTILFSDIREFTKISADMPAVTVVDLLNLVFNRFDAIVKKHGGTKIKTIGDGYMAVAGAPEECSDHAERLVNAAMEFLIPIEIPEDIKMFMPSDAVIEIRIGMHTGPVVAGVVGQERFMYDVYSDAVNVTSRMETTGEPGKIHITSDLMRHLHNRMNSSREVGQKYSFETRGEIEVKGKGKLKTFFIKKEDSEQSK